MSDHRSRKNSRRRRRRDNPTDEIIRRVKSRLDIKPIRRSGGGKMPKFLVHHNFRYGPEPKDKIPVVKPSRSGTEPWTEPEKSKPKNTIIKDKPDTEELLKRLEKHFDNEVLERVLERMDEDFEALQREMTKDSEETNTENTESTEHSIAGYFFHDPQAGSVPLRAVEVTPGSEESEKKIAGGIVREENQIPEVIPDPELEPIESNGIDAEETAQPDVETPPSSEETEPQIDVIEQLENQDLSSLENELYHPETPIENEPLIDHSELQADSLEEHLAKPLEVEQVEEAESGY